MYDAAHRFDVDDDGGVHSVVCRGVVQVVDCLRVGAVEGVRVDLGRKDGFGRFVVFEAESFGEEVVTLLLVRLGKYMVRRQKVMSGKGLFREERSGSSARAENMRWGLQVYEISSVHACRQDAVVVGCVAEERAWRDSVR